MATFDDVKAVVVEQLSIDADAVKMESKIIEDLGADSLDVVELIMALEEKFEVEIPDSDAEKLIKIEDVVNYIDNLKIIFLARSLFLKRVVVTGIGMINALGLDKESSFKAICNGESGVNKITLFDATDFPVQIAAEVKNFDPLEVVDGKEVKIDRFIQLGIKAAREAMQDAGFSEELDKEEFGIVSASGIGGLPNIEKFHYLFRARSA